MKKTKKTFQPEANKNARDSFQLIFNVVLCVFIFAILNISILVYIKLDMWYWLSYTVVGCSALFFLFTLISTIKYFNYVNRTTYTQKEMLQRQMTSFICDAVLGNISKEDLERLRTAADNEFDEPDKDDFSLMSRDWFFWRGDFEFQDQVICRKCGLTRKEHAPEGCCP
jgi:hypothetical protein